MIKLWLPVVLLSAAVIFWTGKTAAAARANLGHARTELKTVSDQATELVRLRHRAPEESLPAKPTTGLAAQVAAALSRSGLPASTLQSLSPESQSGSGVAVHQRATLNLAGLTLPQFGSFLSAWRGGGAGESGYTVSSIDLSPMDRAGSPPSPGADLPLRAVIMLEGVFRNTPSPSGAKP